MRQNGKHHLGQGGLFRDTAVSSLEMADVDERRFNLSPKPLCMPEDSGEKKGLVVAMNNFWLVSQVHICGAVIPFPTVASHAFPGSSQVGHRGNSSFLPCLLTLYMEVPYSCNQEPKKSLPGSDLSLF